MSLHGSARSRERRDVSLLRSGRGGGLAVDRRQPAGAGLLHFESSLVNHIPEDAMQGGAVGSVAEPAADVILVKFLRHPVQCLHDLVAERPVIPPGFPPGVWLGRQEWRRRWLRNGSRRQ